MSLTLIRSDIESQIDTLTARLESYSELIEKVRYPTGNYGTLRRLCTHNMYPIFEAIRFVQDSRYQLDQLMFNAYEILQKHQSEEAREILEELEILEREGSLYVLRDQFECLLKQLKLTVEEVKFELQKIDNELNSISDTNFHSINKVAHDSNQDKVKDLLRASQQMAEHKERANQPHANVLNGFAEFKLTKFSGNIEDFDEFWTLFNTNVHERTDLHNIEKIVLLKDCLTEDAAATVKGIRIASENYEWMINVLNEHYNRPRRVQQKLAQQLLTIKPGNNLQEWEEILRNVTCIINQLVGSGEKLAQFKDPIWSEVILSKFSENIQVECFEHFNENLDFTMMELLHFIRSNLSICKYIENEKQHLSGQNKPLSELECLKYGCNLCNQNNHTSLECQRICDPAQRRHIAKSKQLCWNCLTKSHKSSDCPNTRCSNCGENHHISLCIPSKKTEYKVYRKQKMQQSLQIKNQRRLSKFDTIGRYKSQIDNLDDMVHRTGKPLLKFPTNRKFTKNAQNNVQISDEVLNEKFAIALMKLVHRNYRREKARAENKCYATVKKSFLPNDLALHSIVNHSSSPPLPPRQPCRLPVSSVPNKVPLQENPNFDQWYLSHSFAHNYDPMPSESFHSYQLPSYRVTPSMTSVP